MQILKLDLNRIFNSILFVIIALLLISQLALTTPNLRNLLTAIDSKEGIYTSADVANLQLGEITLKLSGVKPNTEIKILQNGEPIAVFLDQEIKVTVCDNSVIEIDGTKIKQPFSVEILNLSANITSELQKKIDINSNISIIGRIFIK